MKTKIFKRTLTVLMVFVMLFSLTSIGAYGLKGINTDTAYPFIYVHGLFGWGRDEGINGMVPYWGSASCDLMSELNKAGYESYAASVGPMSSCWDRVCELYAQLTGSRVDYGAAHSERCGHLRYGRDYSTPMIDGWGQTDENGNIKKINLVGHSFGGATVRMLTYLLANGSAEETAATDPDELSPLFAGGKGDWVNSVTTICAPHDGTTLAYICDEMSISTLAETMCFLYAGMMGRSKLNGFVDFHLEQFGLTSIPGDSSTPDKAFIDAFKQIMTYDDIATKDLYPEGAMRVNEQAGIVDGVYYFSYAYQTTRKSAIGSNQVPTAGTLAVLRPFARMMGAYQKNNISDFSIDSSWLPNDGMVNVVSAQHPASEPFESFSYGAELRTGVWYVMPTRQGHHGTPIGLDGNRQQTIKLYTDLADMIDRLPQ